MYARSEMKPGRSFYIAIVWAEIVAKFNTEANMQMLN